VKAAKLFTGRGGIVSFTNAYHGSTATAVSMISDRQFRQPFEPLLPQCRYIEFNRESDLSLIDMNTACVVAEVFPVGAGVLLPKNDFIVKLRNRCTETGAVLIFDEIQTGFGRTGTMFAFEHFGTVPDILCIAKSMGGGMPVGAFIGSNAVMNSLNNHHPLIGHATTFGGHPLSCVAALAVLDTLEKENIIAEVEKKGQYLKNHLKHKQIEKVEGTGLFNSLHLKNPSLWQQALISCFNEGIITGTHLFNSGALSLKPALTISYEQLDEAISRMLAALDRL